MAAAAVSKFDINEYSDPTFADLNRITPEDRSLIYDQYVQVPPNGGNSVVTNNQQQFQVQDMSNWYVLHDAGVLPTLKIQKSINGAGPVNLDNTDGPVALTNGGWNLFSDIVMKTLETKSTKATSNSLECFKR